MSGDAWRVRAANTTSGWAWGVWNLRFFADGSDAHLAPSRAISSGSASDNHGPRGYEAENALRTTGGFWGGRMDKDGNIWIGVEFDAPQPVVSVEFEEEEGHKSQGENGSLALPHAFLERRADDGTWVQVKALRRKVPDLPILQGVPQACAWRIFANTTRSGWSWDVTCLQFFREEHRLFPAAAICSRSASDEGHPGYEASNAVMQAHGSWGGRKDCQDTFWIGATFDKPVQVTRVAFKEPNMNHAAEEELLQWQDESGSWQTHRAVANEEREEADEPVPPVPPLNGPPPNAAFLTAIPSQPMKGPAVDYSLKSALQEPRQAEFRPDPDFYLAENCEGLWVCVSKACGEEVFRRVCAFVRELIPEWQRRLWLRFVSPKGFKDPGPMRLIILDNRSGEEAGCIPELQDGSKGRNGTSCPFVFSSREDFTEGVCGWTLGALTGHEIVHGSDMVLRQLHDPWFHEELIDLYAEHRYLFEWGRPQSTGRHARKYCYAAANQSEFLAECHILLLGMLKERHPYTAAGICTPEDLQQKAPKVVELLRRYFIVPPTLSLWSGGSGSDLIV
eukprot:TRINITY_DN6274_c0_g1_i3.p1 TRINITY_DN6274_c0_g1~~TRINITY_DN6274_c0_g1_i3.p1  ORF type:complete len:563 (+),score=64.83 TRINITY_DN6274_c0_g1_i3:82-1770(+)